MPLQPAAIAIILNDAQTEVLLTLRSDLSIWVLPGGGIEPNETAEEAIIREVKEETELCIEIIRLSGVYTPINRLASHTSVFVCRVIAGTPKESEEVISVAFYSLQNLPPRFFPLHLTWLQEALTNNSVIQRRLHEVSYFNFLIHFFTHPWIALRYCFLRCYNSFWRMY